MSEQFKFRFWDYVHVVQGHSSNLHGRVVCRDVLYLAPLCLPCGDRPPGSTGPASCDGAQAIPDHYDSCYGHYLGFRAGHGVHAMEGLFHCGLAPCENHIGSLSGFLAFSGRLLQKTIAGREELRFQTLPTDE